jgi:hypothetical protein
VKIEGKIIDSSGEPLQMANITIQDGTRAKKLGVSADLEGNFTLENEIIEPDSVFMISYIGFEPKLIKASELNGKEIKLLDSLEDLDEVSVSGKPNRVAVSEKPNQVDVSEKPNKVVKISEEIKFKKKSSDQKYIYAGILALAGILLIIKSIKK